MSDRFWRTLFLVAALACVAVFVGIRAWHIAYAQQHAEGVK